MYAYYKQYGIHYLTNQHDYNVWACGGWEFLYTYKSATKDTEIWFGAKHCL